MGLGEKYGMQIFALAYIGRLTLRQNVLLSVAQGTNEPAKFLEMWGAQRISRLELMD
jgi:hypothetical protein